MLFHRRADEDDKIVVSEAPYRIREQLRSVLRPERDTAQRRAVEAYKKLFIGHHLSRVDQDRMHLTAVIGRLWFSFRSQSRYASGKIGVDND